MIIILGACGLVFLLGGLFIVCFPDRYTAWRRRRQPEVLRMLETRSLAEERPVARGNGWLLVILGAGLLLATVLRAGPPGWYVPGVLVITLLGVIVFVAMGVSVMRQPSIARSPSPDEIRTIMNRLRASQGLPPMDITQAEIDAAFANARVAERGPGGPSRLYPRVAWSKIGIGFVLTCGLLSLLGRTIYPVAANQFGYALPGDAFGDLPGRNCSRCVRVAGGTQPVGETARGEGAPGGASTSCW